ncbi:hypothetical protein OG874_33180 [Nocardia sp. NBC_00565]|uniref:hypothetical protein n=1 Tax=Nocardia sp. NBC_00565 TaxID=2975993 RepID=UPI002E7FD762|nr:hypothetical protein [Nocardia sp. NBC_00565]WUC01607.1 hypothetical protein OG874_33180 [Nocardia sp. NBC_00565]
MSATASPRPDESDVHLSVYLHGARFDFAACVTAALIFILEHQARHYLGAVQIIPGDPTGLPRLPGERLYLVP